jgi:hypothetical protein
MSADFVLSAVTEVTIAIPPICFLREQGIWTQTTFLSITSRVRCVSGGAMAVPTRRSSCRAELAVMALAACVVVAQFVAGDLKVSYERAVKPAVFCVLLPSSVLPLLDNCRCILFFFAATLRLTLSGEAAADIRPSTI